MSTGLSIYDHPKYYDLIYGSDYKAELDFLEYCFNQYVPFPVDTVFEPACGTGRLLFRLAKLGYQVGGLDLNAKAIDFCNRRLERIGIEQRAVQGDMSTFQLAKPVDACFNTVNSFRHLLDEAGALGHLRSVQAALKPGGIYVLGIHLLPKGDSTCNEEAWSARRGNLAINTNMWRIDFDRRKRLETFRFQYQVYTPTDIQQISDEVQFRTYTVRQIRKLVNDASLRLLATYDFAYAPDEPVEMNDETEDIVLILQRK